MLALVFAVASAAAGPRVLPADKARFVLRAERTIAAPREAAWVVLTDVGRYHEWNPWLVGAMGRAEVDARVEATVMLGDRMMEAGHVVLLVDAPRVFCWRDAGWWTPITYGQRCRTLEETEDGGVVVRQELLLDRVFAGAAMRRYGEAMQAGMEAELEALERRLTE